MIRTKQEDIIYLVSSFEALQINQCSFLFTDRHAVLDYAEFFSHPKDIDRLNWKYIKTQEWGRQYGAECSEVKQAECLVHKYMPREAIIGIAVKDKNAVEQVKKWLNKFEFQIPVKIKTNFYF